MPMRPCLTCGKLTPNRRCPPHETAERTRHNNRPRPANRRPEYTAAERKRRADTVTAWIQVNGFMCPGFERPPHPSTDLTADHITDVHLGGAEGGPLSVLCRSCNSAKGATR